MYDSLVQPQKYKEIKLFSTKLPRKQLLIEWNFKPFDIQTSHIFKSPLCIKGVIMDPVKLQKGVLSIYY